MEPEKVARTWLGYHAVYCAVVGVLGVLFAGPVGRHVGSRTRVVQGAGIAMFAWAGQLWRMRYRPNWRVPAIIGGCVNIATSLLLLSSAVHRRRGRLLLGGIALEMGTFGAIQLMAGLGDSDDAADEQTAA